MRTDEPKSDPWAHEGLFATTHWSVVLAAGETNTPQSAAALEQLCRTYWYPLYGYVRRQGHCPEDAQDLTQEFFARLLTRNSLARVAPDKGRFRSFLLAALRHFLSDQRDRARAAKRGGGAQVLSLDGQDAEERYRLEAVDHLDAEKIYERGWATALLEHSLHRLREESAAVGKAELFAHLRSFVAGDSEISCAAVALEMGLSEGAVKSALHRFRVRYRELVREEIAQTVACSADIDAEIRYLVELLSQ